MRCKCLIQLHVYESSCAHHLQFSGRVCWCFRGCVPFFHSNRGTGGLTTSGNGRVPLITPAPPTITVKCFDGRWPQHAEQVAPQWNAAHGSNTLAAHGTRRRCDHCVGGAPRCRHTYTGLHGPITMKAQYGTTVGPCSAILAREGHGPIMGTPCVPEWARSPPHSVCDNACAPPWRSTDPPYPVLRSTGAQSKES